MLSKLLIASGFLLLSFNASACDDKPCEQAYVSATEQYVSNDVRRARAYRLERVAYSKIREKRDYALYQHLRSLQVGRNKH